MAAPLIRLAQKRKTVIIQRVIFDLILLVAPPAGVYLILGQKFLVFSVSRSIKYGFPANAE